MMCAVSWFSVRPGLRNFMNSQCAASPIAPTMRKHSCSSSFLTARASIIGVMPSTQSIFASLKIWIMLMSMKSTPSFMPSTPRFFISCLIALVNFVTCWVDAGPGGALDPRVRIADIFLGDPRRMLLDVQADVALLEQHRRVVAAEQAIAQPGLQAVPAGGKGAGHVAHVLVVHQEHRAQPVRLHALARALEPVFAQPIPIDALLPIQSHHADVCHNAPQFGR